MKKILLFALTMILIVLVSEELKAMTRYYTELPFRDTVFKRSAETVEYRVNLRDLNHAPHNQKQFENVIKALNKATSKDIVTIHINSLGGWYMMSYELITTTLKSKAGRVLSYINIAASAAAVPPFLVTTPYYNKDSIVMFHIGTVCKTDAQVPDQENCTKPVKAYANVMCKQFKALASFLPVTDADVAAYCEGKDVFVYYNQLQNTNKYPCKDTDKWCRWEHK